MLASPSPKISKPKEVMEHIIDLSLKKIVSFNSSPRDRENLHKHLLISAVLTKARRTFVTISSLTPNSPNSLNSPTFTNSPNYSNGTNCPDGSNGTNCPNGPNSPDGPNESTAYVTPLGEESGYFSPTPLLTPQDLALIDNSAAFLARLESSNHLLHPLTTSIRDEVESCCPYVVSLSSPFLTPSHSDELYLAPEPPPLLIPSLEESSNISNSETNGELLTYLLLDSSPSLSTNNNNNNNHHFNNHNTPPNHSFNNPNAPSNNSTNNQYNDPNIPANNTFSNHKNSSNYSNNSTDQAVTNNNTSYVNSSSKRPYSNLAHEECGSSGRKRYKNSSRGGGEEDEIYSTSSQMTRNWTSSCQVSPFSEISEGVSFGKLRAIESSEIKKPLDPFFTFKVGNNFRVRKGVLEEGEEELKEGTIFRLPPFFESPQSYFEEEGCGGNSYTSLKSSGRVKRSDQRVPSGSDGSGSGSSSGNSSSSSDEEVECCERMEIETLTTLVQYMTFPQQHSINSSLEICESNNSPHNSAGNSRNITPLLNSF